jgi:hypothetical protein
MTDHIHKLKIGQTVNLLQSMSRLEARDIIRSSASGRLTAKIPISAGKSEAQVHVVAETARKKAGNVQDS